MTDAANYDPIGLAACDVSVRHLLHGLTSGPAALPIWEALPALKLWLDKAIAAAGVAGPQNTSAAEWLLDNDFQVQRAIRQVGEDLPLQFYKRLPAVVEEDGAAGLPRTYFLAHELLHATHLQLGMNSVVNFVERYQDDNPLTIAELWAFPCMLRLACMELLVSAFASLFSDVPSPFTVGPGVGISATGDDTECVSRAIANLVVIATIQWKDFFDVTSRVEAMLQRDPAGTYPAMEFDTRDRYRRRVEWMADHCALAEWEVGQRLLDQCAMAAGARGDSPGDHVGYWLIGPGQPEFEHAIGLALPLGEAVRRFLWRYPRAIYVLSLALAGLAAFALPLFYLAGAKEPVGAWLLVTALVALPA